MNEQIHQRMDLKIIIFGECSLHSKPNLGGVQYETLIFESD